MQQEKNSNKTAPIPINTQGDIFLIPPLEGFITGAGPTITWLTAWPHSPQKAASGSIGAPQREQFRFSKVIIPFLLPVKHHT